MQNVDLSNFDSSIVADLARLERRLENQEKHRRELAALKPEEGDSTPNPAQRTSPVEHQMFGQDHATHKVSWKSTIFGTVTIGSDRYAMGKEVKPDPFTMVVPISFGKDQPEQVTFSVKRELTSGIRLFRSQMGPVTDCTEGDMAEISFPLGWVRIGPVAPETIQGRRDMDLVFMDTAGVEDGRKGIFVVLEVSISTRRGSLYLGFQRVYSGQVVRTTAVNAEKFGLQTVKVGNHLCSVVPLMPEDAYPGNNFFKNFRHLAEGTVRFAVEAGASVPLSHCVVAEWAPNAGEVPSELAENGWVGANAEWFNSAIGFGFVFTDDGQSAVAHFKAVQDKDGRPLWKKREYPMLTPRARLAVRLFQEEGRPNPKATEIRVL